MVGKLHKNGNINHFTYKNFEKSDRFEFLFYCEFD